MKGTAINTRVAEALTRIRTIADQKGVEIIQTQEMQRSDRELLVMTGWLQQVIKGWYMLVRPDVGTGDSAAWYTNFWDFLYVYLQSRFGSDYCLSADSSLALHVDTPLIPKQIIVIVPKGSSSIITLPYDTSILVYEDSKNFPSRIETKNKLHIMPLALALCKVTASYFKKNPQEAEIACQLLKSTNELIQVIVENNFKAAATRLIGAYQFLGEQQTAQELEESLKSVGIKTNVQNPFEHTKPLLMGIRSRSPYVARIKSLWTLARDQVISNFPKSPSTTPSTAVYLKQVDNIYAYDAYHSLSIEGYQVTPELIERVKNNHWDPHNHPDDKDTKNALAARGYYEAFLQVKVSIQNIFVGQNAGKVIQKEHQKWYRGLFSSSVQAGIIKQETLFGYRNDRVFIRGSRHTPLPKEAIVDAMEALFECMIDETHPAVRAIMGHYLFVFIHPYMDGNGRMSRFLMNSMLAAGGYNWTVIDLKNRKEYMQALQEADQKKNFIPFTQLIKSEMKNSKKYLEE